MYRCKKGIKLIKLLPITAEQHLPSQLSREIEICRRQIPNYAEFPPKELSAAGYSKVECQGSFDGGSVGGTPQSGRPLGRWMRFGSQSSPATALNRYKYCMRIPMRRGRKPNATKYSSLISNFFLFLSKFNSCSFDTYNDETFQR